MAELLPCPFCGGEARIIVVEKGVHSIIQCTTSYCGFMRHSFNNGDTDEHAALRLTIAWNTRTPTADVVQIVRCKDCKHLNPMGTGGYRKCLRDNLWKDTDDFCSRGERRKEDDKTRTD